MYVRTVRTSVTTKFKAPCGTDIMNWDPAPLDSTLHRISGNFPSYKHERECVGGCVYVCVCQGDRERERKIERETEREREVTM
jgi:hypothetical protein